MGPDPHAPHALHEDAEHEHLSSDHRRTNGKSVASLALGVVGFVVPLVPSILAVVLGHAARNDLRMDHTQKGDGLALTGMILGWIGIAIAAIGLIAFGFFI